MSFVLEESCNGNRNIAVGYGTCTAMLAPTKAVALEMGRVQSPRVIALLLKLNGAVKAKSRQMRANDPGAAK